MIDPYGFHFGYNDKGQIVLIEVENPPNPQGGEPSWRVTGRKTSLQDDPEQRRAAIAGLGGYN